MIFLDQALRMTFKTSTIDDTSTSTVTLKYRKADGTEGERTDTTLLDAPTREYYVDWENDQLDELRTWTFWSYVVTADGDNYPGEPWQDDINPEGDYPVSREQVKSFLGITDTLSDAKIDALLPMCIEQYLAIRNAPFDLLYSNNTIVGHIYPKGIVVTISLMIDVQLTAIETGDYMPLSSERIGSYSYTAASGDSSGGYGYPSSIISTIKRYGRAL